MTTGRRVAFGRGGVRHARGGRRPRVARDRRPRRLCLRHRGRAAHPPLPRAPGARDGPAGGSRSLGLAALDTVVVIGDRAHPARHARVGRRGGRPPRSRAPGRPSTSTTACPAGATTSGPVRLEVELAMAYGVCAVGVVHRLLAGEATLEVTPLCTWRDQHGDRFAGADPVVESSGFGPRLRVRLPGRGPGLPARRRVVPRRPPPRGGGAGPGCERGSLGCGDLPGRPRRRRVARVVAYDRARTPRPRTPRRSSPTPGRGPTRWRPGRRRGRCRPGAGRRRRPLRRRRRQRTDRGRRLPVVRRVVARPVHLVRGSVPVHRTCGGGSRGAATGGRKRLGGHARQHRRRRDAGVQHDRRHAVVPARAGPTRRSHRRPRPRGRAVRHRGGHPDRPPGRHPVRDRGRHRDRPAAWWSGRVGADLDGRTDRRATRDAARRLPGRDRGALDQRRWAPPRPAGPGRAGRSVVVGAAGAGGGLLRTAVRARHVAGWPTCSTRPAPRSPTTTEPAPRRFPALRPGHRPRRGRRGSSPPVATTW